MRQAAAITNEWPASSGQAPEKAIVPPASSVRPAIIENVTAAMRDVEQIIRIEARIMNNLDRLYTLKEIKKS